MTIDQSYNAWSLQYDTNENKTRDLEKVAALKTLKAYAFKDVIELGCGTGKNTEWLSANANSVIAIDFSSGMIQKAKEKIKSDKVQFMFGDISKDWLVPDASADLVTCSLVLEHIDDLDFIFSQAARKLRSNGLFYICELHPYRQYAGSKAKYPEGEGIVELQVFIHNISDFTLSAVNNGFVIEELKEWFDEPRDNPLPRLISFVFRKK